jgi:hypothetical protein
MQNPTITFFTNIFLVVTTRGVSKSRYTSTGILYRPLAPPHLANFVGHNKQNAQPDLREGSECERGVQKRKMGKISYSM